MKDGHHDRQGRRQNRGGAHYLVIAFLPYLAIESKNGQRRQSKDRKQRNCPCPGEPRRQARKGDQTGLRAGDSKYPN